MAASKTEITKFEDRLTAMASQGVKEEQASLGPSFISTKSGVLSYKGQQFPNNSTEVVIVSKLVERLFYTERYDPQKIVGPKCFALGHSMDGLRPNATSPEPQAEFCVGCCRDKWGSSLNGGKGKACSEKRRLLVMSASDATTEESVARAEVAALRVPVTSVRGFGEYNMQVAGATGRPLLGVVTKVSLVPDSKTQFKLIFSFLRKIEDEKVLQALIARSEKESSDAIEASSFTDDEDALVQPSTKF